jgi:acyl-CoA thioesterase-2
MPHSRPDDDELKNGDSFVDVTIRPCRYEARASWVDQQFASSQFAVRMDAAGRAPSIWFPWHDVRAELMTSGGVEAWMGGEVERFDLDGTTTERGGPVSWARQQAAVHDGIGVVRRWVTPPLGLGALTGHATIDHTRARVELIDTVDGDDPRDVMVKRFPGWGDTADLISILSEGSIVRDQTRPVVEASQTLGRSIVAAMRHAPGRRIVAAQLVSLRSADHNQPMSFDLDELSHGRTFSSVVVSARQGNRLCASTTLLLGVPANDVVNHAESTEPVVGPYDSVPYDMGVTGRDLRVVDAAYTDDPDAPVGPPIIDAWVRFRDVPDEPAIHAALLAQFTGHMSIAAALRPHAGIGQIEAHRTISTAINAIAISFHADINMDRWVRYRHLSTVVNDGMSHSECRVYDEAGELLASFTVDAMIRPLDRPSPDDRTAL